MQAGAPQVFLTDFGLAKNTVTGSRYTRTGATLGTPSYMSPEQARGELTELTPASDVWALGCVLYELLANRKAFDGDTPAAVVGAVLSGSRVPVARLAPSAPSGVRRLVDVCLSSAPRYRPARAAALGEDCRRVLAGQAPRHRLPRRRLWGWTAAVSALAAVAVAVGTLVQGPGRTAPGAGESAADTRVERAWAMRHTEAGPAIALLEHVLAEDSGHALARLRLGLLRWATGDGVGARREWSAVPPAHEPRTRADWLRGLCAISTAEVEPTPALQGEAREAWTAAAAGTGPEAAWAKAGLLLLAGRLTQAEQRLAGEPGWEAALLRGMVALTRERTRGTPSHAVVEQEFTAVLTQGIPLPLARAKRALARAQAGRLDDALADVTQALASNSDDGHALVARAYIHVRRGRPDDAERDLTAAIARHPRFPLALTQRGRLRVLADRIPEARADLDAVLAVQPDSIDALAERALVRLVQQEYAGAIADADEVLACDPTHLRAQAVRGDARRLSGDAIGARHDYDAVLERAPRYPRARLGRAELVAGQGDHAGALRDLTVVIDDDATHAAARMFRGETYLALGRFRRAYEDFQSALGLQPHLLRAQVGRGNARGMLGDPAGASADYEAVLAVDSGHALARFHRARLRQARRDFRGAVEDYTAALDRMPDHVAALSNRGGAYLAMRHWAAALADFDRALELEPEDYPARLNRAILHARRRETAAALADADAAARSPRADAEAFWLLGGLRRGQGDTPRAIAAYRRFLQMAPDDSRAPVVRQRLAQLTRRAAGGSR